LSSGFITAALKLEETLPVESERFISERIAGPTIGRSSLRTFEGRTPAYKLLVLMPL
jgi:hypothetical protein